MICRFLLQFADHSPQPPTSFPATPPSFLQKLQIVNRRFPCLSLHRQLECAKGQLESTAFLPIFPVWNVCQNRFSPLGQFHFSSWSGWVIITSQMLLISFLKDAFVKSLLKIYQMGLGTFLLFRVGC